MPIPNKSWSENGYASCGQITFEKDNKTIEYFRCFERRDKACLVSTTKSLTISSRADFPAIRINLQYRLCISPKEAKLHCECIYAIPRYR